MPIRVRRLYTSLENKNRDLSQAFIGERAHLNGHRPAGTDLLAPAALFVGEQHTGHLRLFVHVQTGAPLFHDLHSHLRAKGERLAWRPDTSNPDVRAHGRPWVVPAGTPGPTAGRARGTTIKR